jgi:starch synthase
MSIKTPGSGARRVLIIGSEALPFAKTGGLADVLGALPSALARLGWDVTLVLPRYRAIAAGDLVERFTVTVGGYIADARFYEAALDDSARAILVDVPDLYDRDAIYGVTGAGYPDNARRFATLVRAAFEFVARRDTPPAVVHAHDWQAGLAPVYLKTLYARHPMLGRTPSVITIHNLAYQGLFEPDWLPRLDLSWDLLSVDRLEFWEKISFLKGGINDADAITTVSPRYAQEIQTPELGFGFDGILRRRAADLVGILNGIDTRKWDPARDELLPAPYSIEDLSGKRVAKGTVLSRYGLPADAASLERPLIGMVSRMVDQKGFDLIAEIAEELPRLDASFLVLGAGESRYEDLWRGLAARHPDRIGARIGFDEPLAHLIEAGADIFLMPSRFEPCGLNQMYSLRYGTVPVVRAVGGLADTVRDYEPLWRTRRGGGSAGPADPGDGPKGAVFEPRDGPLEPSDGPTGFVFQEYTPQALLHALGRALAVFNDEGEWRALQMVGMRQDHSWDRSAREYVKIYETVIARRARVRGEGPGLEVEG